MGAAESFWRRGGKWRAHSLRVIEIDQFAPLFFEICHADFRERLERATKLGARPPRALGNTTLFATIARQKDNDPIGFTELVGAEHERIGGI
jgi:hypothetical protein